MQFADNATADNKAFQGGVIMPISGASTSTSTSPVPVFPATATALPENFSSSSSSSSSAHPHPQSNSSKAVVSLDSIVNKKPPKPTGTAIASKAGEKFPAAKFCKDNSDLIHRQALALKQAIKEAKAAEERRLFTIEIEKNPVRVKELEERYTAQRQLDQERIIRIKTDFDCIKAAVSDGDVNIKERNKVRSTIPILKTMDVNRFAGLETQEDIILHRAVCDKYHKMEEKNKRWNDRNLPKVDVQAEKNKLNLLLQKQDVLTKMIDLQTFGSRSSQNTRRSDSASSVVSGWSSASTQYSWASFGGNSTPGYRDNKAIQHKSKGANVFIPPLKLHS